VIDFSLSVSLIDDLLDILIDFFMLEQEERGDRHLGETGESNLIFSSLKSLGIKVSFSSFGTFPNRSYVRPSPFTSASGMTAIIFYPMIFPASANMKQGMLLINFF